MAIDAADLFQMADTFSASSSSNGSRHMWILFRVQTRHNEEFRQHFRLSEICLTTCCVVGVYEMTTANICIVSNLYMAGILQRLDS